MAKSKAKAIRLDVPMQIKETPQATLEKAANGFVIRSGYGSPVHIAKTMQEAQKIQAKLLNKK